MAGPVAKAIAGLLSLAAVIPQMPATPEKPPAPTGSLSFRAAGTNGFEFDTGVVRGRLGGGERVRGLSQVVHVPTGTMISRAPGLFGHYRVFTANHRYGDGARDWPVEATLQPDGSVTAHWPATDERPFTLRATYRWVAPDTLELVTTVRAKTNLAKFESFLASYFAPNFTNALAYVADLPDCPGAAGFLAAEPRFGTWLAFPRDAVAMAIFRDGRWTIPPSPVQWVQMPPLARPLGIRRDPATGLTAVIMAPPADAFALCTPEQTEGHYSMYLSLFGRDLQAGESASARARLVVGAGRSDRDAVKLYESFLQSVADQSRAAPEAHEAAVQSLP